MFKFTLSFFVSILVFTNNIYSNQRTAYIDSSNYVTKSEAVIDNLNTNHRIDTLDFKYRTLYKSNEDKIDDISIKVNELVENSDFDWDYLLYILFGLATLWFVFTKKTIPDVVREQIKKEAEKITEEMKIEAKIFIKEKSDELLNKEMDEVRVKFDVMLADFKFQENNPVVTTNESVSRPEETDNVGFGSTNINTEFIFRHAFNEKSIRKKIELYKKVIAIDKNHVFALNNLGILFQELDDYPKSIEYFDRSISSKNNYHLPYINKAESLSRLNKYNEALKTVNKGIELNPSFSNGYYIKAFISLRNQKEENAFSIMKDAIEKYPKNSKLYQLTAFLYYINKEYDKSIHYNLKAAELNFPDMASLMNNIAVNYRMKKEFKTALNYLEKAKSYDRNFPLIYGTTALIYADLDDREKFYKYIKISLIYGCPIWKFLDDQGFEKYKDDQELNEYIEFYKKIDRNTLFYNTNS